MNMNFFMQVTDAMKVLYVLRKDEEKVGGLNYESHFDMEACLVNLAQRQIDLEDEEAGLTKQVAMLIRGFKSGHIQDCLELNHTQDEIGVRLIDLKREEEELMKDLFWLNQNNNVKKVLSKQNSEEEDSMKDFAICTAFSPSSKSIKMMPKLQEKRLSLDSGYSEDSKLSSRKNSTDLTEVGLIRKNSLEVLHEDKVD